MSEAALRLSKLGPNSISKSFPFGLRYFQHGISIPPKAPSQSLSPPPHTRRNQYLYTHKERTDLGFRAQVVPPASRKSSGPL